MSRVLDTNNDFAVRTREPVHSGKVRSVYWLTPKDSARLIKERGYDVVADAPLALMMVSDRISAFECLWRGEQGLGGVPGKGAALNSISKHWFDQFQAAGLARSHVLEAPHPLVWIVQRAEPIKIEAIARQYITGSMWRAYHDGERHFCGIELPDGLARHQRLTKLLITPSTKDVMRGLVGIPEVDDVNIARSDIERHWRAFGFHKVEHIAIYERLLAEGFELISGALADANQLFVDTKFEFGYARNRAGEQELIYMDEVGTPDSSRIWEAAAYEHGRVIDNSKEAFRQALLGLCPDPELLLDKRRLLERQQFAKQTTLPESLMMSVSTTYRNIAEQITGAELAISDNPRAEINQLLADELGLLD